MTVAPGYADSYVANGFYTMRWAPQSGPNYLAGFAAGGLTLNGGAALNGSLLRPTRFGVTVTASSAFHGTPVSNASFISDFAFQLTNAEADGITFCIQGDAAGPAALGKAGGYLGYAGISTV